jgi:hypothetical protein
MAIPTTLQSAAVGTAYYNLVIAIQAANPIQSQSYSTIFNLVNLTAGLISALDAYIAPLADAAITTDDLGTLVAAQNTRATFYQFQLALQSLLGSGYNTPILTNSAVNLYQVASQYYPQYDVVEAAVAICQANKLKSMFVEAGSELVLPTIFGTDVYGTNTD